MSIGDGNIKLIGKAPSIDIEKSWASYADKYIHPSAGIIQYLETKNAFISGLALAYNYLSIELNKSKFTPGIFAAMDMQRQITTLIADIKHDMTVAVEAPERCND